MPRDLVSAYHWFLIADATGDTAARERVGALERHRPPAQLTEGRNRARETVEQLRTKS